MQYVDLAVITIAAAAWVGLAVDKKRALVYLVIFLAASACMIARILLFNGASYIDL